MFYVRADGKDNEVRGVTILYDKAMEVLFERMVFAISNGFIGFPGGAAAAGSAPRQPVEYATGIVVSRSGDILTGRAAVEDCKYVIVDGLGNAQRVADDKDADLALLRVFGARDLVPVPLVDTAGGSDVTLVGIADPQSQDGGGAVTTLKARVLATNGAARTIEPTPAHGFTGAAAVSDDAKLLGIVELRPPPGAQAAMVPAETIRTFLQAQSIAPAGDAATLDGVKASVVRVICVRK